MTDIDPETYTVIVPVSVDGASRYHVRQHWSPGWSSTRRETLQRAVDEGWTPCGVCKPPTCEKTPLRALLIDRLDAFFNGFANKYRVYVEHDVDEDDLPVGHYYLARDGVALCLDISDD